jgi:thiol-disulfide isomerase/thioredoxin
MNQYPSSIRPLPSSGSGLNVVGGTTSIIQQIISALSWKTIGSILLFVIISIITYYVVKMYSDGKSSFHANRENIPKDDSLSTKQATLMLFYVDWCPHCNVAKPEWESLKADYDGKSINGYTLSFVEYNCTEVNEELNGLMDKYEIEGYPTIKLIKDNQVIEYDAKPTKSTMVQFLNTVL